MRFQLSILACVTLALGSAQSEVVADLFADLDTNGDGVISASEVGDSQRPFFERAVRVADQNGDGQLNQQELNQAIQDPQPRSASGQFQPGNFRNRANMDRPQLDRDGNGYVSKEEVPAPLQQRMQPLFDRYDGRGIPIQVVGQYFRNPMQGNSPQNRRPNSDDSSPQANRRPTGSQTLQPSIRSNNSNSRMNMANNVNGNRSGANQAMLFLLRERIDANKDGNTSGQELRQFFRALRALDRNQDGDIDGRELSSAQQRRGR